VISSERSVSSFGKIHSGGHAEVRFYAKLDALRLEVLMYNIYNQ
jgi:hypothetical protein